MMLLIPARGGSRTVPRKNLAPLNGIPLIHYAIKAALAAKLDNASVIVSTDDKEIADEARTLGATTLDRTPILAEDSTPMSAVVLAAAKWLAEDDILVLIQPTNPFVRPEHIAACAITLRDSPQWNSIQTIAQVSHNDHYLNQRVLGPLGNVDFMLAEAHHKLSLKEQKPPSFRFGTCVAMRVRALREQQHCFPQPSEPIVIDPQYALDIDTKLDFMIGEAYIKHGLVNLQHMGM